MKLYILKNCTSCHTAKKVTKLLDTPDIAYPIETLWEKLKKQ